MKLFQQIILLLSVVHQAWGFVSPSAMATTMTHRQGVVVVPTTRVPPFPTTESLTNNQRLSPYLGKQRKSVASVQMQGIFGLGFGEIAVILVVVGFVLGPQNIGRLLRSSADRASAMKDELDRVPEEFKKGMEEGESTARSRKARVVKVVKEEDE